MATQNTLVGRIQSEVLTFTVGREPVLDVALTDADCIGSAAHVTMLSRLAIQPRLFSAGERNRVVAELVALMRSARAGRFHILESDQDVHLAVERVLTRKLGSLGKRIHTARSRNDQIAVDLRLFAKEQLLAALDEAGDLIHRLLRLARRHAEVPMVGRTHLQPAMPSSVGVWASGHAEGLLDDMIPLLAAFDTNDRCPLGSAAGYGVPLPIDRQLTARLLGFKAIQHNVFHASNSRGKSEYVILGALTQVMLTLSRLSEDLILFSMPEFGYFSLPPDFCTGSSIMPQKQNPDVLELVRAKASTVLGYAATVAAVVSKLPGGYNRDLQETKEPFMNGLSTTRACLRILAVLVDGLRVNRQALMAGFSPTVFATDRALELVAQGLPFRDAYVYVKNHLDELRLIDPRSALARKTHAGAPAGLDFGLLGRRLRDITRFTKRSRATYYGAISRLLGQKYPELT